jgi:hypothetical protein
MVVTTMLVIAVAIMTGIIIGIIMGTAVVVTVALCGIRLSSQNFNFRVF